MRVNESTSNSPFSLVSIVVVLAVTLGGCASVRALSRMKATLLEDAREIDGSPLQQNPMAIEVVQSYYDWHWGFPGNVMAEGAYRSSEYLTESFVDKVSEVAASFDRGGYDPFLCTQDVPGNIIVHDEVTRLGDTATMVVCELWNPGTDYEGAGGVVVELQVMDGEWRISNTVCQ